MAGGSPQDIRSFLSGGPAVGAAIHYLPWRPSADTNPEWYADLKEMVERTAERRRVNSRTLNRFGRLWVRNLAANAPILPFSLSLEPLRNRFQGIPALIVAGGPSLDDFLFLLPISPRVILSLRLIPPFPEFYEPERNPTSSPRWILSTGTPGIWIGAGKEPATLWFWRNRPRIRVCSAPSAAFLFSREPVSRWEPCSKTPRGYAVN